MTDQKNYQIPTQIELSQKNNTSVKEEWTKKIVFNYI